ncbi:MAG: hypothetical protein AAGF12_13360 [Myxococcota bacterium]
MMLMGAALGTSVGAAGQDRAGSRPEADAPSSGETAAEDEDFEVDSDEISDGQGKVKVFKFSGLDISGRLKSPQLLYFLNRLRAEFDRPRLPHRSFMPELVRSSKSKAL